MKGDTRNLDDGSYTGTTLGRLVSLGDIMKLVRATVGYAQARTPATMRRGSIAFAVTTCSPSCRQMNMFCNKTRT